MRADHKHVGSMRCNSGSELLLIRYVHKIYSHCPRSIGQLGSGERPCHPRKATYRIGVRDALDDQNTHTSRQVNGTIGSELDL